MKTGYKYVKRIFAMTLIFTLLLGAIPAIGVQGFGDMVTLAAQNKDSNEYTIDNGYIKVTVSDRNGGFGIRTIDGDKVNKDDDNKYLLFDYDEDNTSFTSFQVERNGEVKEYIFGGKYANSSEVHVSKVDESLVAVWSVDDLTFTQTITLVNSGANEHGMANINYTVKNTGDTATIKCRILMDTALGYQDYAFYSVGDSVSYVECESTVDGDGYDKAFYAVDNISAPAITAYTVNASINSAECIPYQTTFAHWNNLAATVFEYTADADMTFTNPYNKQYLTADSAYALYFDMGEVAANATSTIATNYGIFSNESVEIDATVAVNLVAPDVLQLTDEQNAYENNGKFSVKTSIENIGDVSYEDVRVLVYTSGGIDALNQSGEPANGTYENPYYIDFKNFKAGENKVLDWYFTASPKEGAQYAKIQYKVYNISDDATLGTGAIMKENLIGEGSTYILCPGSVDQIPKIKFTGSTPEILYTEGVRNLYITGDNFSMLLNKSEYKLMLSRVDGNLINGKESVEIPSGNISIEDANNTITLIFTDDVPGKLAEGMYQLTFDYTDESKEDLSAPALRFQVKDDVKYKNDAYGFLAVLKEEESTDHFTYRIVNFATEEDYNVALQKGELERRDVLLEFRGSFIKEDKDTTDGKVVYKGVSLNKNDNIMTLNGCLDIKDGTTTVTENNGSVTVDFDADIYTTGAGTSVWSGVCALTELEAGVEYGLIPYDEDGNREGFNAETITLLWPSVGQGFQNLMGLLFEFKYGELGIIKDDEPENDTRVVAFGAALDLSFIIPDSVEYNGSSKDQLGDSWNAALHNEIKFSPEEIRALNKRCNYKTDTVDTDQTSWKDAIFGETGTDMEGDASGGDMDAKAASIQIDDILFGGKYLGTRFAIALGIPGYVEGMPAMEAILSVNTVGDWAFGVSGACSFSTFFLEGTIDIKSKDGIPVPDTLSFFMGGVVPGVNVDCVGVLWLQGAGGGIENLYDTIFLEDTIPPLKLILEAQFSVMQVISAKASLGLSLRGIDVALSNGKVANMIPVLNYAGVQFEWYPEFFFLGNVQVSVFDAIVGAGYIVAEESGLFEFFIRAALQIPSSIPIVGGMSVADAGLGANTDKLWGQVRVIDIPFGVTYYWGGDIDWNSGDSVKPTYPELAGMGGSSALAMFEVGTDEETGESLYAFVGTNMTKTASSNTSPVGDGFEDEVYTDVSAKKHSMTLVQNGCGKLLVIEWTAEDENVAVQNANAIVIEDNNGTDYTIELLDHTEGADEEVNADANANLTYNPDTKTATLAISFTNTNVYNKVWNIETAVESTLVLYDVAALPEVSDTTTMNVSGNELSVTLHGEKMNEFSNVSFMLEGKDSEEARLVYRVTENITDGSVVTFTLPEDISSGEYVLKIMAQDENGMYYSETEKAFTYVNNNQPAAPVISNIKGAGNYKVSVSMDTDVVNDSFDGYVMTAYDEEGNVVSGISNVHFYKDGTSLKYNEDGSIALSTGDATTEGILIGGHYEFPYENEAGEEEIRITGFSEGNYTVEVRRWKMVSNGRMLYSDADTQDIYVKKPIETILTVAPVLPDGTNTDSETVQQGNNEPYELSIFNSDVVSLKLSSATETFNGRWELDGGTRENTSGVIPDLTQEVMLSFANLEEGTHTFSFVGKNQFGDSTAITYSFRVDTEGPRLMLDAPLNGSTFDYKSGELTISGITDADAYLTVVDNDMQTTVVQKQKISQIDDSGRFSTKATLDTSVLSHNLTIFVEDTLGNKTEKNVSVTSDGLGHIEDILIYAGDTDITNTKITAGTIYGLKLYAKLQGVESVVELNDADLIEWSQVVVNGDSELVQEGASATLKTSVDAEGMILANFIISDAGAYSIGAAFGDTEEGIQILADDNTQLVFEKEQLYTSYEVKPVVEVWYKGTLLVEGVDYQIIYSNNIEVSTGASTKPQLEIIGINHYTGSIVKQFEISYLPMDKNDPFYTISGVEGNNGYYVSDVNIVPKEGYELVVKERANITLTEDKTHVVEFSVRRMSDGALTDKVSVEVKLDKTTPTGTLSFEDSKWNKFLETITFGHYKLNSKVATITAEDAASGVDEILYVISEDAYTSVSELENANPNWKKYNDSAKPSILENKNQVIYVKILDYAGNAHYISSDGIHEDTIAPTIHGLLIKEDDTLTSKSLAFSFMTDEMGTYYYAVVKAGQKVPTAEELKSLTLTDAKVGSGKITSAMCNKEVCISVDGLEAATLYVVYLVVEDATICYKNGTPAPNTSEVACSNPVSTLEKDDVDTGDHTDFTPWIVLLVIGMLCILVGIAWKKGWIRAICTKKEGKR